MKALLSLQLIVLPFILNAAPPDFHDSNKLKMFLVVLFLLFFAFCIKLGLLAFSLVFSVLKPQTVIKGSEIIKQTVVRSFITGLLCLIFYLLLLKITRMIPRYFNLLLAVPILIVLFIHIAAGFSVICHFLGEKIHANIGSRFTGSTFMAVLYGGIVILALGFVPIFGQAASLIIITTSLGATLIHMFSK